ncbi:hypothetical protein O5282_27655 [Escherichia coli]|nr:hypothetical protein [Escherichia coli]
MEFKDLPSDGQKTAASYIAFSAARNREDIASEPAKRSGPENQDRFR